MSKSFPSRFAWLLSVVISLAVAPGLFAHPGSGIAVDRDGVVYFTNSLVGVCRIDKAGKIHLVGGSAFHWMAIDERGAFADVPDSFGEWFERATPRRSSPTLITCSDFPCTIGSDGNLYYAKGHQFTIVRRTPAGQETVLARYPRPEHWSVTGLARGPEGTIYAMAVEGDEEEESPCAVFRVSRDGKIETIAGGFSKHELPADQRHYEAKHWYGRGLCMDDDGNIYVAMTGNRCVIKLNRVGEASAVLRSSKPWTPTGFAVHDGDLYVLEYDDETPVPGREWPPRIRKVARDGSVVTVAEVVRPAAARQPK